jgi:hypothetical protein
MDKDTKIKTINTICIMLALMSIAYIFLHTILRARSTTKGTYKMEMSLRYPGSYDINIHTNYRYNLYQIWYKVKITYPSMDVFLFYRTNLKRMGWVPFAEKGAATSYDIWQSFADDTRKGAPKVYQLLAKWKKKNELICLSLRYYSSKRKSFPDNDVQHVDVSVIPFNKVPPVSRPKAASEGPDFNRATGGVGLTTTHPVVGGNARWIDSYDTFKMGIRHDDTASRRKCEDLLYNILKRIDDNNYCEKNIDCTLLSEAPFGAAVPIRKDAAPGILETMRSYKESCDNGAFHGVVHPAIKNEPACWGGRCMVKSF